ncbi:MAG: DUF4214 domain-containing protein [Oribacterium sp.]|nr:DUF4214 domain-containing protein [Oribacterium sp.]MBP3296006.1 DUF4214 domain-containing protein [Lachnospiraceae bacterium]
MANKWLKKLGVGMSMIMLASQLSEGMVFAAPEEATSESEAVIEQVLEEDSEENTTEEQTTSEEDEETDEGVVGDLAEGPEDDLDNSEEHGVCAEGLIQSDDEEFSFEGDSEYVEAEFEEAELVGSADSNGDGYFTYDEIQNRINQLKASYPQGSYWTTTGTHCNHSNGVCNSKKYDGAKQCMGYAKLMCYEIFGTGIWSGEWEDGSINSLAVGDYIRYSISDSVDHSVVVTGIEGDRVIVTECNYADTLGHPNGDCVIRWGRNGTQLTKSFLSTHITPGNNTDKWRGIRHNKRNTSNQSSLVPKEYTPFSVASIAEEQIGTVGSSKYTSNSGGWAAYFANWCYRTAGADTSVWPEYANVTKIIQWFQGQGRWQDKVSYTWSYNEYSGGGKVDKYIPQWGDFVVIETNGNDADGPETGGIVISRSTYNDSVTIVVGNQDNKVVSYSYKLSTGYPIDGSTGSHIVGICNVNYGGNFVNGAVEVAEGGAGTIHVKGWAFDYDDESAYVPVSIYIGGQYNSENARQIIPATFEERSDINEKYGITNDHGFDCYVEVPERGQQEIWVYAEDIGTKAYGGCNIGPNEPLWVTITDPSNVANVTGVLLNKSKLSLSVSESESLTATVTPANATSKSVIWSSDDKSVATVDAYGRVTAISAGTTIITVTTEDGNFTANCEVTVTGEITPGSHEKVVSFVDRIYTVWLERTPDSDGAEAWTKRLENRLWSGAQVAEFFVFSKESMDKNRSNEAFVDALYKLLMNRDPVADPEGYKYWVEEMNSGRQSKFQVVAGFIASPEYTGICADYGIVRGDMDMVTINQVQNFVQRFYTLAMERDADQSGVDYWTAGLRRGDFNGASIAANFFFGKEMTERNISNEKYIELLYQVMMGRPSDDGGKAYWLGNMANGMTKEQVLNGFITSPEFTGICADYGIERGSL